MLSKARNASFVVCIVAAPIVTALVLGWLFSLDGTLGLYQWMPQFRDIFIAVGVLGVIGPLLALVARLVTRARRLLRGLAVVFAIIGIVVPLAAAGYYLRDSLEFSASAPPLLLVTDGTGANGAPNLALVFRTAQKTRNTLYYGEGSLDQQVAEPRPTREHVLPLKDLRPGTRYQWRLNDGAPCSFETPGGPTSNDVLYHFGVSGDAHFGAELSASASGDPQVVRSILTYASDPRNRFNTFFAVGDVVNMGSANGDWQSALDTIAAFTCGVPLRPVMGNHDAIINGAAHYLAYFYPDGMAAPNGSRRYYRIDAGRVHFIMLNMLWGVESFSAEQRAWFARQMTAIPPDDWRIVMMHSMVYSSGSVFDGYPWYDPAAMVQQVAPLLEKYKVDLVVSGHNHHLEFLQKNGVSYAVVGGFGGKLDPVASHRSPASVWYLPSRHGFLDVVVRPASLELSFRDPAGVELKAFSVGKSR
jgi:hypothetical protein